MTLEVKREGDWIHIPSVIDISDLSEVIQLLQAIENEEENSYVPNLSNAHMDKEITR